MIMRCTCDTGAFCNGENALAAAGLISSKGSNNSNLALILLIPVMHFMNYVL